MTNKIMPSCRYCAETCGRVHEDESPGWTHRREPPRRPTWSQKTTSSTLTKCSSTPTWERNASWAGKFADYVRENCPSLSSGLSIAPAVAREDAVLAFLASVNRRCPGSKPEVKAARRAINALRSLMGLPSLENHMRANLLTRASHMRNVSTVKQSAGMVPVMLAAMIHGWGRSRVWWKRQTVLMALLGFVTLARGAGVTSCLDTGVAWVGCVGHIIPSDPFFKPEVRCDRSGCVHPRCVKGFLNLDYLIPFRKNRQDAPTVAEKNTIDLMVKHLEFRCGLNPATTVMFLDRDNVSFVNGTPVHLPLTHPGSGMSTNTFRSLLRMALRECCGLSQELSEQYGTHTLKIGAIKLLTPQKSRGRSGIASAIGWLDVQCIGTAIPTTHPWHPIRCP